MRENLLSKSSDYESKIASILNANEHLYPSEEANIRNPTELTPNPPTNTVQTPNPPTNTVQEIEVLPVSTTTAPIPSASLTTGSPFQSSEQVPDLHDALEMHMAEIGEIGIDEGEVRAQRAGSDAVAAVVVTDRDELNTPPPVPEERPYTLKDGYLGANLEIFSVKTKKTRSSGQSTSTSNAAAALPGPSSTLPIAVDQIPGPSSVTLPIKKRREKKSETRPREILAQAYKHAASLPIPPSSDQLGCPKDGPGLLLILFKTKRALRLAKKKFNNKKTPTDQKKNVLETQDHLLTVIK